MGGGASSIQDVAEGKTHQEIVRLMMPVWFTDRPTTLEDVKIGKESWELVLNDKAPGFLHCREQGGGNFEHPTAISMFYDTFYKRLFDVHPLSKDMFSGGMKSQGKFLVKMISMSLSLLDNHAKFKETMMGLAESHNRRGIKAIEYGIVGDVMFWTLKKLLAEAYSHKAHQAWITIFSRMLAIIVPVAVAHELNGEKSEIGSTRHLASLGLSDTPTNSFRSAGPKTESPTVSASASISVSATSAAADSQAQGQGQGQAISSVNKQTSDREEAYLTSLRRAVNED